MAHTVTSITYTGHGASGNWADPANWAGGVAPGAGDVALVTTTAAAGGTITLDRLMMLGQGTTTFTGTLNTLSTNACQSFMVCDNATAVFTPGSTLNDAGGLIVGIDSVGTFLAQGQGTTHATLNTADTKLGKNAHSSGTMTVDDTVWHTTNDLFIGCYGAGALTVQDNSQVSVGGALTMGLFAGGTGLLTLSTNSVVTVANDVLLGYGGTGTPPGQASATIDAGATLHAGGSLAINANSSVVLAGGAASVGEHRGGAAIALGGTLSGYGTLTAPAIVDAGTILAKGGTLTIAGAVSGTGQISIGADSTVSLTAGTVSVKTIAFAGADSHLLLARGIADHAAITGFAAGDTIVMTGIDHADWNASKGILTLSHGTTVVDKIALTGTYDAGGFTIDQTTGTIGYHTATHSIVSAGH